jgi:hypothetical protein
MSICTRSCGQNQNSQCDDDRKVIGVLFTVVVRKIAGGSGLLGGVCWEVEPCL